MKRKNHAYSVRDLACFFHWNLLGVPGTELCSHTLQNWRKARNWQKEAFGLDIPSVKKRIIDSFILIENYHVERTKHFRTENKGICL